MMSNHSLFAVEAVSGFGYFDSGMNGGGGSSSSDSPSSMGSGGESLVMQRSVSSHNGFSGNFSPAHDFVYDDDGPVRRALSAGDIPVSNIIYTLDTWMIYFILWIQTKHISSGCAAFIFVMMIRKLYIGNTTIGA